MRSLFFISVIFLTLNSCSTKLYKVENLDQLLDRSELGASKEGKDILIKSREMIAEKEVIRGSCWDYINAVFKRASYPSDKRISIFKSKIKGPYADETLIQPGDWLYYINHSYRGIDHSGIFVAWVNFEKKEALVISYVGGKKNAPGRYQNYNLSNVYSIIRPKA